MNNRQQTLRLNCLARMQAAGVVRSLWVLSCLFLGLTASSSEAAAPAWANAAEATYQLYQFTTDATAPLPTEAANAYGTPTAAVHVSAPQGTGWQDPAGPYDPPSGVNDDGAWDLGPGGSIEITLPFAPPLPNPESTYEAEVYVYLVGYEGLVALPTLSVLGHTVQDETSHVAFVKGDGLSSYQSLTWSGRVTDLSTHSLTLKTSASSAGALVDSLAVYTRYTLIAEEHLSYDDWVTENFPGTQDPAIIGFDAAPDEDGMANGLKYYLGRTRDAAAEASLMLQGKNGKTLTFRHTRAKNLPLAVSGDYQWSRDLTTWHADGTRHNGVSVEFSVVATDTTPPDHDVLTVEADLGSDQADAIFIRLQVEENLD